MTRASYLLIQQLLIRKLIAVGSGILPLWELAEMWGEGNAVTFQYKHV